MKNKGKIISIVVFFILSIPLYSQSEVTEFLGIPIDGSKVEMIKKLEEKGYIPVPNNEDILTGEFNGTEVYIAIATNNNKVNRIMVSDADYISETDIKIRFNNLCGQFNKNEKYIPLTAESLNAISDEEDISYGILVEKKRYDAIYSQTPIKKGLVSLDSLKNTDYGLEEGAAEKIEELERNLIKMKMMVNDEVNTNKIVWFTIVASNGKYKINMFYDNLNNKANGEDL